MTPHGLIEFMQKVGNEEAAAVIDLLQEGVVFHAGNIADLPDGAPHNPDVRPPFDTTVMHSVDDDGCHVIVGVKVLESKSWLVFAAGQQPGQGSVNVVWFQFEPSTGKRFDLVDAKPGDKVAARQVIAILVNFFSVIACSNVRMVDVPAPEALNKKRAKAGKPPIKSHKVLHIVAPSSYTKGPHLGGTHNSPRVHLRRGHIRKLPGGSTVWVQQCVVGSKHGIVTKDYSVSYAQQAAA